MKPCIKCGATDRNKKGDCKPCAAKYNAKWYANNKDKRRIISAKWYTAHSEKRIATALKWTKANPELSRIYKHNRRAREKANGGKLSNNLSEVLFKRQKGKCACCEKSLGKDYHLDHIMPIALGGANEDWNIQLLRASCNKRKSAKHPIDYMRSQGLLL